MLNQAHEQIERNRYPIGCHVCVFEEGTHKSFTIKEGIVKSVSINPKTKKISYQLTFESDVKLYNYSEDEIGFAIGCKVGVSDKDSKSKTSAQPATVVLVCRNSKGNINYTVELVNDTCGQNERRFERDICSTRISDWPTNDDIVVSDESDTSSQEMNSPTNEDGSLVLMKDSATNDLNDSQIVENDNTTTPLAIRKSSTTRVHSFYLYLLIC